MRVVVCAIAMLAQILAWSPAAVLAESSGAVGGAGGGGAAGVEIYALRTGPTGFASQEFVQLRGIGAGVGSMDGWKLQYRAASKGTVCSVDESDWKTMATLSGYLAFGDNYLAAAVTSGTNTSYLGKSDITFSAGMSAGAGTVRIIDASGMTVDAVAWGGASCGAAMTTTLGVTAPTTGDTLVRAESGKAAFAVDSAFVPSIRQIATAPSSAPVVAQTALAVDVIEVKIELSEVMIDTADGNMTGFVELYNAGDSEADLSGFTLMVAGSSYTIKDVKAPAGGYLAVASADSGLALTDSGQLELLAPDGSPVDKTEWSGGVAGSAWAVVGGVWTWTAKTTSGEANIMEPVAANVTTAAEEETAPIATTVYPTIEITELLPDPVSPQMDATDEFIELHNPNDFAVSLAGYQLQTGKTLTDKYTLPAVELGPDDYLVIKSSESHVALANTGSNVALVDPLGAPMDAVTYPEAEPGVAYAKFDGTWAWTTAVTPAAANAITAPVAAAAAKVVAAKAAAKAAATKTPAVAKTTTKKLSSKTPAAKKTTTTSKKTAASTGALPNPGLAWLLFALAGITIGYIIYEFRYDIRSYYHKFRGYQKSGEEAGEVA